MLLTTLFLYSTYIAYTFAKTCCVTHDNAETCHDEWGPGSPCIWLDASVQTYAELIAANSLDDNGGTGVCVGEGWAACELQPTANIGNADCVDHDNPPPVIIGPDQTPPAEQCVHMGAVAPEWMDVCPYDWVYNVQFILDESGSITKIDPEGYTNTVELVKRLITNSVTARAKVSMLTFSADVQDIYSFLWDQDSAWARASMAAELDIEKTNYAGETTDTYSALMRGCADYTQAFEAGKLDPIHANVIILITDGTPYCGNVFGTNYDPDCKYNLCDQNDLLTQLSNINARIIVVGITSGFTSESLHCLADKGDIYEFRDFKPETLAKVEKEMRNDILCPAQWWGPQEEEVRVSSNTQSAVMTDALMARMMNQVQNGNGVSYYFSTDVVIVVVILCLFFASLVCCHRFFKKGKNDNGSEGYYLIDHSNKSHSNRNPGSYSTFDNSSV